MLDCFHAGTAQASKPHTHPPHGTETKNRARLLQAFASLLQLAGVEGQVLVQALARHGGGAHAGQALEEALGAVGVAQGLCELRHAGLPRLHEQHALRLLLQARPQSQPAVWPACPEHALLRGCWCPGLPAPAWPGRIEGSDHDTAGTARYSTGKGRGGKRERERERERVWGCEGTEACYSAPHLVAPEAVDAVARQAVGLYLDLQGDVEAQDLVLGGQVEGLQQQALRPSIVVLVVQAARLVQQQLGICVVEKPAHGMAWVMLCAVGWGSRCTDVRSMRDNSKPAEHAHPRLPTSCKWHWRLQHQRVHRHVQPWDPHCATLNVGMA